MDQNRQFQGQDPDQEETDKRQQTRYVMRPSQESFYDPRPRDAEGRLIGRTDGLRALWLGIFALTFFATGFNIFLALLALVFGLIQLIHYSSKEGRLPAVMGIALALLSVTLLIGSYARIARNPNFLKMLMNAPGQDILKELD